MATIPELPNSGQGFNLGYPAVLVTLLVWVGFFISLRASAQSVLTIADIAQIRFTLPAIFFSCIVFKQRKKIAQVPKRYLVGIICGSGLPFFYLGATGMQYAPVAHGSTLIPGTLPLFVTSIAVFVFKEPLSRSRKWGLSAICIGIAVLLSSAVISFDLLLLQGHLYFLSASFLWAIFTISMRMSGLNAFEGAGISALGSLLLLGPYLLLSGDQFHFHIAPVDELLFQFVVQGLCVGLIAGFSYGFAISRLGAEMTAAFGSFTPVLAGVIAIPVFNEWLDFSSILGMVFITLGTLLASEIFKKTDNNKNVIG